MLLVDLGNTKLKWSVVRDDGVGPLSSLAYGGIRLATTLAEIWGGMAPPKRVLLASVAGPATEGVICEWIARTWNVPVEKPVARKHAHGVTVAYAQPERFGVDRWLALISAHRRFSGPVCILDCGTAVTVDALDGSGQHLGGFILPGEKMMRDALERGTNIGPLETVNSIDDSLGRDTASAVAGGALWAYAAIAERVANRMRAELRETPLVVVTGGDGQRVQSMLNIASRYESDLVMLGLAIVAGDKNR